VLRIFAKSEAAIARSASNNDATKKFERNDNMQ
jgi:hypothetical protein